MLDWSQVLPVPGWLCAYTQVAPYACTWVALGLYPGGLRWLLAVVCYSSVLVVYD